MSRYLIDEPPRVTVSARLSRTDRRLVELAAEAAGARSLSAYVADRLARVARQELVGRTVAQADDT